MDGKILTGRKLKALFFRGRMHRVFGPLHGGALKLGYMTELSRWIDAHRPLPFTDDDDPTHRAEKRYDLYRYVFDHEQLDGPIDYLEFGVASGRWFRWWVEHNRHPDSRFAGFDTFTGLPESWGGYGEGAFSTEGRVPDIADPRCRFIPGLFQDTLGPFLEATPLERRLVLHLDADLYSSTIFPLTRLFPSMRPGTILLFDEFAVPTHEYRAFMDFVSGFPVRYEVLGAVNNYLQVAIRITAVENPERRPS